jgi:hypothetical protein
MSNDRYQSSQLTCLICFEEKYRFIITFIIIVWVPIYTRKRSAVSLYCELFYSILFYLSGEGVECEELSGLLQHLRGLQHLRLQQPDLHCRELRPRLHGEFSMHSRFGRDL